MGQAGGSKKAYWVAKKELNKGLNLNKKGLLKFCFFDHLMVLICLS